MDEDGNDITGGAFKFLEPSESTPRKIVFNAEGGERPHFQIDPYQRSEISDIESPRLLDPNHPLLEKFQRTLKEHLEKQIEHLTNEVFELETGAKKKNVAREELGLEVYEAQQNINKQQKTLETYMSELQTVTAAREQTEYELNESLNQHDEVKNQLIEAQKEEIKLRDEIKEMNMMIHHISKWSNDIESELTVNQRVFEKTKKEKVKLAEEKRSLDVIIYRLMTEIWRMESELETMDMQLRVKEEERERMAEQVTASNIDIETFNSDYRCLMHSWNSIIVAISHRDNHFNLVQKDLDKLNEKITNMLTEISKLKKMANEEMMRNESLTVIKCRNEDDIANSKRLTEVEITKRDNMERLLNNTQGAIDQIEKDIEKIGIENAQKANQLNYITREFEKLQMHRVEVEEEILVQLEEQLTNSHAAKYMSKYVHQVREVTKNCEIKLAEMENLNGKFLMNSESQKCANEETQRFLDELIRQQNAVEAEVNDYIEQANKCRFTTKKKQRDGDLLNKKIEELVDKLGGVELSPLEVKINALEKNIEETQLKNNELQHNWLRQQGHVVYLSQQRQQQICDLNILRKQVMLLTQKNLKIGDELDAFKAQDELITRNVNKFLSRIDTLNEMLSKKKGDKELLDKCNTFIQNQYLGKLKDAELESLKLEAEIQEIEQDKVTLSDELIELNREALQWEKKIQMAIETKKKMEEEKSSGGEVGNMRAEIHRMNVRYSQLKKAQDKLIVDLEHCVSRRDAIITGAEAREKRLKGPNSKVQTRISFNKKLDDLKNKLRQTENDIETVDVKLKEAMEKEDMLKQDIGQSEEDIQNVEIDTQQVQELMEQLKVEKQKNLEILVIKQKQVSLYTDLSKNRCCHILYRTDSTIGSEYEKQKELNNKLINIVENLLSDFPNHYYELLKICNTLKIPTMCL